MRDFDPKQRTKTLARIVGPYMLVMAGAILARLHTFELLIPAFMQDAPLVLATGAFTLMAGLALVTAHHHWTSPAAIAISLIGIVASLKGASLMIAPEFGAEMTAAITRNPPLLTIAATLDAAVGAWLTFHGWLARPPQPRAPT